MSKQKLNQEVTEEMFIEELENSLNDFLKDDDGEESVEKRYTKIKRA